MTGVFNAKRLHTWHAIAPTYAAMIVIIMDMLPWTAQIRYCHLVHQHAAGLTPMIGVGDPPLDVTATPDAHAMITETDLDSATLDLAPTTTAIEVIAAMTLTEVTPDHSTDLPTTASHMTGALVPITNTTTHLTADLHPIEILPKMTADHDTDPVSNTTDQPEDLHPLHRHHPGIIRIRDTNRSPLMTHRQSTTAPMTMKGTQMMI